MTEQKSNQRGSKVHNENIGAFSTKESADVYSSGYIRSSEEKIISLIKPGDKVLDVGSGAGRVTRYIKDIGANVIGIEPAKELLDRAKKNHPDIDFRNMDVLNIEFPDNTFDLVLFSFNGIDNLYPESERNEAISEMRRVLKPGGTLAFSSQNSLCIPHTMNGWRIVFGNLLLLRPWGHYRVGRYDKGIGKLTQFFGNVWQESSRLKKLGMKDIRWISNGRLVGYPRILQAFLERFPMYISKKDDFSA